MRLSFALLAFALPLAACGDDDQPGTSDVTTPDSEVDQDVTPVETDVAGKPETTGGDGVMTDPAAVATSDIDTGKRTLVDAESSETWTYLSLTTGALANPLAGDAWDLGFQRYLIKLGAGASATVLDGQVYADLVQAPAATYAIDPEGATMSSDFVLGQWYNYDPSRHTLSPTPGRVYVVKTAGDNYFKVALRDYYDDAGSSGFVTFDWAPIAAPNAALPGDVIATTPGSDLFFDLGSKQATTSDGPWDIVFRGTYVIGTNSGTSGTSMGGARVADVAWDALTSTDTVGFTVDTRGNGMAGPAAAHAELSTWFDYDPSTHVATVAAKVFIVRGHDGAYYKLRATEIGATGHAKFQFAALTRAPRDHELVLDASGGRAYANLAHNATGDAAAWDLSLQSVSLQTNGGTSGDGQGGAALLGDAAFTLYTNLSVALSADAMLPVAGPPGSGDESRSAPLDAWYAYNPVDHSISATPNVFVVALADGSRARVTAKAYAAGKLTLLYTYAGPGHDAL